MEVKQEHSDYSRKLQIKGSFEKDSSGNITGGSVLKRLYTFFEAIGCTAGLNVKGEWEDEDGKKIEDIAEYLNIDYRSTIVIYRDNKEIARAVGITKKEEI